MRYLYIVAYSLVLSVIVMPWVNIQLYYKINKAEYVLQEQRDQFKLRADLRHLHNLHITGF